MLGELLGELTGAVGAVVHDCGLDEGVEVYVGLAGAAAAGGRRKRLTSHSCREETHGVAFDADSNWTTYDCNELYTNCAIGIIKKCFAPSIRTIYA